MKVHIIHSGNFKLDGGAMFGVVPKSIWNKLNPSKAILDMYNLGVEERDAKGMLARQWVTSDESMMSARAMSENFIQAVQETLNNWKPRERFHIKKIEERPLKTLKHYISL